MRKIFLTAFLSLVFFLSSVGSAFANPDITITDIPYEDFAREGVHLQSLSKDNKTLPRKYSHIPDLNPVLNQGTTSDCWTFASSAAVEDAYYHEVGSHINLSHTHMAKSLYKNGTHPYSFTYESGGNINMAIAYYARSGGPVLESAFNDSAVYSYEEVLGIKPFAQVSSIEYINDSKSSLDCTDETLMNKIKTAIMENGIVQSSYYSYREGSGSSTDGNPYFNKYTGAYYYNGKTSGTNHSIAIVGWDDDYPTSNFSTSAIPPGKGAWVVRNSWGDTFGDGGYCYVSYYDKNMAKTIVSYHDIYKPYDKTYTHSPLGMTSVIKNSQNIIWGAATFSGSSDKEELNAIGVYVPQGNQTYSFAVTDGVNLSRNTMADFLELKNADPGETAKITFENPGFYVAELKEPLSVSETFSVYARITAENDTPALASEKAQESFAENAVTEPNETYVGAVNTGVSYYDIKFPYYWYDAFATPVKKPDGSEETRNFGSLCLYAYTNETKFSVNSKVKDNKLNIDIIGSDLLQITDKAYLKIGFYKNGRLAGFKNIEFKPDTDTISFDGIDIPSNSTMYKIFIWDEDYSPIIDAISKTN